MKKIIVPTDFSPYSFNALQYARHFAAINNGQITIIHASKNFGDYNDTYTFDQFLNNMYNVHESLTNDYILKCKTEIAESNRQNIAIQFFDDYQEMENKIGNIVTNDAYDLLIIGTKGSIGWKEKLLGNHTVKIIEKVSCPVLAITKRSIFKPIENIVFATDLEEDGEEALRVLQNQADLLNASLGFVHIKLEETRSIEENIQKYKLFLNEILGDESYKFELQEADSVLTGLHQYTTKNPVSIMALLQRREQSLDDLFTISFSKKLAFNGDTPVMIFKK
jgi:nucleotide-binding universal stress UspA family protein